MSKLTGNKNTDFLILMQLTDNDLGSVCQSNRYVKSLCDDDIFWFNRIKHVFKGLNYEIIREAKDFLEFTSWKEFYKYLREYQINENDDDVSTTLNQYMKQKENMIKLFSILNWPDWIKRSIFERKLKRENIYFGLYYNPKTFINDFLETIYKSSDIEWVSQESRSLLLN